MAIITEIPENYVLATIRDFYDYEKYISEKTGNWITTSTKIYKFGMPYIIQSLYDSTATYEQYEINEYWNDVNIMFYDEILKDNVIYTFEGKTDYYVESITPFIKFKKCWIPQEYKYVKEERELTEKEKRKKMYYVKIDF